MFTQRRLVKKLLVAAFSLCFIVACTEGQTERDVTSGTPECWIDTECTGEQICLSGVCRTPEGPELDSCFAYCHEYLGCPPPFYYGCAENGQRYCSACAMECVGTAPAADLGVCKKQSWNITHFRLPCIEEGPHLCMYVSPIGAGGGSFELFGGEIEGFEPIWGYDYIIDLDVEAVADPPADGPSWKHTLVAIWVTSSVEAGTTFDWPVLAGMASLIKVEGTIGTLGDSREFRCDPESLCGEIEAYQLAEEPFRVHFRYDTDIYAALVVTHVEAFEP